MEIIINNYVFVTECSYLNELIPYTRNQTGFSLILFYFTLRAKPFEKLYAIL